MKKLYSIGQAAEKLHVTTETLRHYDRIALASPSHKDSVTNYRYYTEADIVRLHTIRALQQMDLPLSEIKKVLDYDDLGEIISFLELAEKQADEKIAMLQYGKAKIQRARAEYQKKLLGTTDKTGSSVTYFPQRTILLSETLNTPSLDTLWNYLSHFYNEMPVEDRASFVFEDMAGMYVKDGVSHLFAVCLRHVEHRLLRVLPAGNYLCAYCTQETQATVLATLLAQAKQEFGCTPDFSIQMVVVSGILQWDYQVQVYVG